MINKVRKIGTTALLLLMCITTAEAGDFKKNSEEATCETCVSEKENSSVSGTVEAISSMAKMVQVKTKAETQIITFNDETIILGVDSMRFVKADSNVTIDYKSVGGENIAISIEVVTSEVVLGEKEIDAYSLAELVFNSTETLTVVDARPNSSFSRGFVPGSISIYNGLFDKNINLLPKDKDQLVVYYCEGTA